MTCRANPNTDQDGDGGAILAAVEVVLNVVRKLLQFEWENEVKLIRTSLETVLGTASDSLQSRIKDQRDAKQRVDAMLDELEKPWAIR